MTKQKADSLLTILHTIPVKPGRFPKIEEISVKLNLPKYKASKILKELNELGMLSRTGNWYNFINPIEVSEEQAKDYIDAITEENKHDSIETGAIKQLTLEGTTFPNLENKINDKLYGDIEVIPIKQKVESFNILRWLMLGIGIISAALLVYYISIYARENLSNVLAYIRSIIIVLFSFTSFQAIIILSKRVKNIFGYIGIVLFFMFWLMIVTFSMISTIAGQFQLFSGKQENINISSTEYNDTIVREKELLNNRNILLNQINPYLKQLNTVDEKQLSDVQYRITLYNKAVQKIDDELKVIRDKKVSLSNGKVIEQNHNFYSWLSGIIKWSSDSIQLFLYILPALFLDLIGPISFSIFLFMKKKEE